MTIDNITQYPFFSHSHALKTIFADVTQNAPICFLGFKRIYPNLERIYMTTHHGHLLDYFKHEFYKYGFFENYPDAYQSSFHMWDHFPYDPHGIYAYLRDTYGFAHGLSILQRGQNHCDFFLFAATSGSTAINNYYLDAKECFLDGIQKFYTDMKSTLEELDQHRLWMPAFNGSDLQKSGIESLSLSRRQLECAFLLIKGYTMKETARCLSIAPRTVEDYIKQLKNKFHAPNRTDLLLKLHKVLA